MSTFIPHLYLIFGGIFFLYFIILWIYCRRIPAFGWFWPAAGTLMTILGLFTMDYTKAGPDGMTTVFFDGNITAMRNFFIAIFPMLLFIIALICFIAICIIASHGKKQPSPHGDYLIVLGAHVNGKVPSKALMSRIMAAHAYLKENPSTKAVLTGGQGNGEEITEAMCMKQELLKLGIDEGRLLIENRSTTTEENIGFGKNIIKDDRTNDKVPYEIDDKTDNHDQSIKSTSVIIVTNDFHALRGVQIAKKAGFKQVQSIGAPSSIIMKPHYYTREILSWIKLGMLLLFRKSQKNSITEKKQ